MNMDTAATHLGESELLHLVDGDAGSGDLDRWNTHVEDCVTCSDRLDELRANSGLLRVELAAIQLPADFPTVEETMRRARAGRARQQASRGAWGDQRWLRVAAVILILLLPAALITPVRAALVDWVRQGWSELVGGAPSAVPDGIDGGAAGAESGYTVYFTPAAPLLEITVEEWQAGGELVITPVDGPEGSLEVRGGQSEDARIDDRGLTIRNGTASTGSYLIGVPEGVQRLRVRIGGAPPELVERTELSPAWRRSLAQ